MKKHEVLKGMYMVALPAGSFTMGHVYDKDEDVAKNINAAKTATYHALNKFNNGKIDKTITK